MEGLLRILHLEDDEDHPAFVFAWLSQAGWNAHVTAVSDLHAFQQALTTAEFDLILSDSHLPTCTALDALALARQHCPDTPFVLISGTVGEDAAIRSPRHGTSDYLLKHWTDRLLPTLHQAGERRRLRTLREEVQRRERRLSALNEHVLDIVALLAPHGRIRYPSPATQTVLSYEPDSWMGQDWCEFVHPEGVPPLREAFQTLLADHPSPLPAEFRMWHNDGQWPHMEALLRNRLEKPNLRGLLLTCRDISVRKQAEQQVATLARLGRQLNAAASHAEAARAVLSAASDPVRWDTLAPVVWNAESQTLTPVLLVNTLHAQRVEVTPTPPPRAPGALARQVRQNGPLILLREPPLPPPGEAEPFDNTCNPSASLPWAPICHGTSIEGLLSVQCDAFRAYSTRDLNPLVAPADHCGGALARLRAEQRFRSLSEHSPDAILVPDPVGRIQEANVAARILAGSDAACLTGRCWIEFPALEERPAAWVLGQNPATVTRVSSEGRWQRSGGPEIPVEICARSLAQAEQPGMLLIVRDVRHRKQPESAPRHSERLFFSVWEHSGDDMCLTDEQGHIPAVNDALCRLRERDRSELVGQPVELVHPVGPAVAALLGACRGGDPIDSHGAAPERRLRQRLTLHNGKVRDLDITHPGITLAGRPPLILSLFRDLTGQKLLEEQLRQAQKMQAIGQLAGGVAHDFNNLLTVLQGNATLLHGAVHLNPAVIRAAEQASQDAERAAHPTQQLLPFSRRQVAHPRPVDLNELVQQVSRVLSRVLGEPILPRLQFPPQRARVDADPGMREQAILNLAVNARDAMPNGGQLSPRVAALRITEPAGPQSPAARPGSWVQLEVADTGCGIPPENLRRIFEPFFTPKEVGKGTGLRLATVHGIAEQHQGGIDAQSTVGRGTTFHVHLPAAYSAPEARCVPAPAPLPVRGGTETILVVEDESSVRELVAAVLRHHGYRVLQAANGPEALQLWQTHGPTVDLLLTDLVMPMRMNGWELAERLRQDRPDLKVIFTSGYSTDVVGEDLLLRPGVVYVQKPYPPSYLARVVRETLDRPAAA